MKFIYIISIALFITGVFLLFLNWYFERKRRLKMEPRKKCKYAILIPARDEFKTIEGLLKSIKVQVKDMSCTYIIVEDKKDKTCKIAKNYNCQTIIRKDLENKRRKGYALDEAIKEILKKEKYDMYFIFDADNILDNNFIKEMVDTYKKGYDIGVGYRNIKNPSNVISVCSGLLFTLVNTLINKRKNYLKNTITISGTGYYISGNLINSWQGFPFFSLTEDYELTLYAAANKISTYYNENAIYYDEQPTNMIISIKQRTRWVKGFFESRIKRLKEIKEDFSKIISIFPYLFLIVGIIIFLINNSFEFLYFIAFKNIFNSYAINSIIVTLLLIYIILLIISILVVVSDKNKFNCKRFLLIKSIFFNPIFLLTFIISFFRAILHRKLQWETIEHKEKNVIKK